MPLYTIFTNKNCVYTVFLDVLSHVFVVFPLQASELGKSLLVIPLIRFTVIQNE